MKNSQVLPCPHLTIFTAPVTIVSCLLSTTSPPPALRKELFPSGTDQVGCHQSEAAETGRAFSQQLFAFLPGAPSFSSSVVPFLLPCPRWRAREADAFSASTFLAIAVPFSPPRLIESSPAPPFLFASSVRAGNRGANMSVVHPFSLAKNCIRVVSRADGRRSVSHVTPFFLFSSALPLLVFPGASDNVRCLPFAPPSRWLEENGHRRPLRFQVLLLSDHRKRLPVLLKSFLSKLWINGRPLRESSGFSPP